jgi:hypothetical protein
MLPQLAGKNSQELTPNAAAFIFSVSVLCCILQLFMQIFRVKIYSANATFFKYHYPLLI